MFTYLPTYCFISNRVRQSFSNPGLFHAVLPTQPLPEPVDTIICCCCYLPDYDDEGREILNSRKIRFLDGSSNHGNQHGQPSCVFDEQGRQGRICRECFEILQIGRKSRAFSTASAWKKAYALNPPEKKEQIQKPGKQTPRKRKRKS